MVVPARGERGALALGQCSGVDNNNNNTDTFPDITLVFTENLIIS